MSQTEKTQQTEEEPLGLTQDEWKERLTPEQYNILREKGTEPAFTGKYVHTKDKGVYRCVACGIGLFSSDTKFDSGTGWPSFTEPANLENVELNEDTSDGMNRMEVVCKNCGSHLGHVFDDLPNRLRADTDGPMSGKRYCINSCALSLDTDAK